MKVYLDYTQEELNRQYNQAALVPDVAAYKETMSRRSELARTRLAAHREIPYGESPDERLDVFLAADESAPVVIYIHGGAWRIGHKDDYSFVAVPLVSAGIATVVPNFGLVPAVSLDEQVAQVHRAVQWVHEHVASYGADPARIFLVGHSSGAHHVGMLVTTDWPRAFGLPEDIIKGAVASSGLYDLAPVKISARNEYLGLDDDAVLRNSPVRRLRTVDFPIVIAYGDGDHEEFRRQSGAFAMAWRDRGLACSERVLRDMNHFDVLLSYGDHDGVLVGEIRDLVGRS